MYLLYMRTGILSALFTIQWLGQCLVHSKCSINIPDSENGWMCTGCVCGEVVGQGRKGKERSGGREIPHFAHGVNWYPEELSNFPRNDFWSYPFQAIPFTSFAWLVQKHFTWAKGNMEATGNLGSASITSSIHSTNIHKVSATQKALWQASLPFTHLSIYVSQTFKGLPWVFIISGMFSGEGGKSKNHLSSQHGLRVPLSSTTYLAVSSNKEPCVLHRIAGKIKLDTHAKQKSGKIWTPVW